MERVRTFITLIPLWLLDCKQIRGTAGILSEGYNRLGGIRRCAALARASEARILLLDSGRFGLWSFSFRYRF